MSRCPTGSAASTRIRTQFLPAVRGRRADLLRDVPGIHVSSRTSCRRSCAIARRRHRAAARRPVRLQGRRHDSAEERHLSRGNWEFNVRAIYDAKRRDDDHAPDVLPLRLPERAAEEDARRAAPISPACSWSSIDDGTVGARDRARDRRAVQELAGRDADRNREGVPAWLRRDDRDDHHGDRRRQLRRDPDHHGGDGEHDGDDGARADRPNTRR